VVSNIRSVDNTTITNTSGTISLTPILPAGNRNFSGFTYNDRGQITSLSSTITQSFTVNDTSSATLSIFNGYPNQTTYTNQTLISAVSGNGLSTSNILLSSAGFIVIQTDDGYGPYAIPVFKF
jgi:hypothetical protein